MKKKYLVYAALLISASMIYTSCDKVKDLIKAQSIDWTGQDVTFDIPIVTDLTATTAIGTGTFTFDLDAFIKSKTSDQLGLKNIDQVMLSSCTVTINNPDANNNIANFESADATLATSANTTPVTIGSVTIPNTYATTLDIPVDKNTNLKSYISPSGTTSFTYVMHAKARTATTMPMHATAHVTYTIHVTP